MSFRVARFVHTPGAVVMLQRPGMEAQHLCGANVQHLTGNAVSLSCAPDVFCCSFFFGAIEN